MIRKLSNHPFCVLALAVVSSTVATKIVANFLLSNLGAKEHSSDVHKLSKTESLYLAVFASHCAPPCVDIELSQASSLTGISNAWRSSKNCCFCSYQVAFGKLMTLLC